MVETNLKQSVMDKLKERVISLGDGLFALYERLDSWYKEAEKWEKLVAEGKISAEDSERELAIFKQRLQTEIPIVDRLISINEENIQLDDARRKLELKEKVARKKQVFTVEALVAIVQKNSAQEGGEEFLRNNIVGMGVTYNKHLFTIRNYEKGKIVFFRDQWIPVDKENLTRALEWYTGFLEGVEIDKMLALIKEITENRNIANKNEFARRSLVGLIVKWKKWKARVDGIEISSGLLHLRTFPDDMWVKADKRIIELALIMGSIRDLKLMLGDIEAKLPGVYGGAFTLNTILEGDKREQIKGLASFKGFTKRHVEVLMIMRTLRKHPNDFVKREDLVNNIGIRGLKQNHINENPN